MTRFVTNRWVALSLALALSFNIAACGTLMHPERKGQAKGKLDTKIVVLNAIGVLFFIIPGAIAFYVDFDNNTIYLPADGGKSAKITVEGEMTKENIEAAIAKETGREIDLDAEGVQIREVDKVDA